MKFKCTLVIQKFLLLPLFIVILTLSCNDTKPTIDTENMLEEPSAKYSHVAFAGGGWRAHTGHAGWIISLLHEQDSTISLEDAFAHVGIISSNSGGSWFNTMMAFSEPFVAEIQAENAVEQWGKTGWLGKQHELFKNTSDCDHFYDWWYEYTLCVLNKHDGDQDDWLSIIDNIVYKGYPINETLSGTRQAWAKDKTLLLASSMLTSNVMLNEYGKDGSDRDKYQYYQACHSPATPKMGHWREAATCENQTSRFHEVTPVTFSGLPMGASDKAPAFFPVLKQGESFATGYSEVILDSDPIQAGATITNPTSSKNVPAIHAAAASSAALGFLSYVRKGDFEWWWEEAYGKRKLALSFSLEDSVKLENDYKLTAQELATKKMVKLADGGPVDNSGVAQIIKYLQLNNNADNFNIIAFDNVTSAFPSSGGITTKAKVGVDIANLFGKGLCGDDESEFCFIGCSTLEQLAGCVDVPELQIFGLEPLITTAETWSASSGDMELIYTEYKVTTVDNANFGITANSSGTLHAFTCVAPRAGTVPTTKEFDGYYDMLNFIYNEFGNKRTETNKEGRKHLKKAFKL